MAKGEDNGGPGGDIARATHLQDKICVRKYI